MMTAKATSPAMVFLSHPLIVGFFNSAVGRVITDTAAPIYGRSYPRMNKKTVFCEQFYLSHEK